MLGFFGEEQVADPGNIAGMADQPTRELASKSIRKKNSSSKKQDDFKPGKSKASDSEPGEKKRAYSIADSVSGLMNSKDLSDVTFIVGKKKKIIYGHKTILSLGSPVFRQM